MKFRLKADTSFDAENITQAFEVLKRYFEKLQFDEDVESIFESGEIEINPIKE